MNPAAPLLLWDRPPSLPIRKTIGTIVWVCGPRWHDWLWWWHNRLRWRHNWLWRRRRRRATSVMNPAAPGLLVRCPSVFCVDCAIEWVNWSTRCGWRSPWWRRRGCGWWRRERCGWNCDRRSWKSGGYASQPHGRTAVVPRGLGPHGLIRAAGAKHRAIGWCRSCCP